VGTTTSSSTSLSSTVSYSRLSTFTECPAKFFYRYIRKPGGVHIPLEDYFLKGDLAHRCLEEYLLNKGNKDDILEMMIPLWLVERCDLEHNLVLDGAPDNLLMIDIKSLAYYAINYGYLLHRCTAAYIGTDAIRNNDKSVPKDPVNYPPKQLKYEYNNGGLPDIKLMIDNTAATINPEFKRFSLCDIAAQAAACFYNFKLPDWVDKIDGVEYTSEKKIPWDNNTKEWAWFVDFSYTTDQGDFVISDHKTSKTKPTGLDVAFHPQLNLYAYLYHEDQDKMPKYLAINHLPSGEFVIAQTDLSIVYSNFKHFQDIQKLINLSIQADCFPGRMPTDYNSPCIRRDWRSGAVTSVCPYLNLCHPRYVEYIYDEVKDLLRLGERGDGESEGQAEEGQTADDLS
jgi:hypothetical protein